MCHTASLHLCGSNGPRLRGHGSSQHMLFLCMSAVVAVLALREHGFSQSVLLLVRPFSILDIQFGVLTGRGSSAYHTEFVLYFLCLLLAPALHSYPRHTCAQTQTALVRMNGRCGQKAEVSRGWRHQFPQGPSLQDAAKGLSSGQRHDCGGLCETATQSSRSLRKTGTVNWRRAST